MIPLGYLQGLLIAVNLEDEAKKNLIQQNSVISDDSSSDADDIDIEN